MIRETLENITLEVTVDGTTHRAALKPGDLVRFEEHFGESMMTMFSSAKDIDPDAPDAADQLASTGIGMTQLYYMAYLGTRRDVKYVDYDDFLDRVDDIGIGAAETNGSGLGKDPSPTS